MALLYSNWELSCVKLHPVYEIMLWCTMWQLETNGLTWFDSWDVLPWEWCQSIETIWESELAFKSEDWRRHKLLLRSSSSVTQVLWQGKDKTNLCQKSEEVDIFLLEVDIGSRTNHWSLIWQLFVNYCILSYCCSCTFYRGGWSFCRDRTRFNWLMICVQIWLQLDQIQQIGGLWNSSCLVHGGWGVLSVILLIDEPLSTSMRWPHIAIHSMNCKRSEININIAFC